MGLYNPVTKDFDLYPGASFIYAGAASTIARDG
jgi:hypothetical protein